MTQKGSSPLPSSIISGTKVNTASMDRWNVTLETRAIEKYLWRKCRKSTKGVLHPPLDDDEQAEQGEEQQVHWQMV